MANFFSCDLVIFLPPCPRAFIFLEKWSAFALNQPNDLPWYRGLPSTVCLHVVALSWLDQLWKLYVALVFLKRFSPPCELWYWFQRRVSSRHGSAEATRAYAAVIGATDLPNKTSLLVATSTRFGLSSFTCLSPSSFRIRVWTKCSKSSVQYVPRASTGTIPAAIPYSESSYCNSLWVPTTTK